MSKGRTVLRALVAVGLLTGCAHGPRGVEEKLGYSGIALFDSNRFIAVQDAKVGTHSDGVPRVSVITMTDKGMSAKKLAVDWGRPIANDLEAICPIPGLAQEYLAAESGFQGKERYERLFRLKITEEQGRLKADVRQVWFWPPGTSNIEGIACFAHSGRRYLLAAQRDGTVFRTELTFDGSQQELRLVKEVTHTNELFAAFSKRVSGGNVELRKISDLFIEGNVIWASAALEREEPAPSAGGGPFSSMIYRLGTISRTEITYETNKPPHVLADGLKIEGLSGTEFEGTPLIYATDDESLGGVVRLAEWPER